MLTQHEKLTIVGALVKLSQGYQRSKGKTTNPKFAPIYDEEIRFLAALVSKIDSMEVTDGKGKVEARSGNR